MSLYILNCYSSFFPHPFFYSPLQNILILLQYDLVRENRENALKAQISEKDKAFQETKSTAEALSKNHSDQLELQAKCVNDMESAKEKEKIRVD